MRVGGRQQSWSDCGYTLECEKHHGHAKHADIKKHGSLSCTAARICRNVGSKKRKKTQMRMATGYGYTEQSTVGYGYGYVKGVGCRCYRAYQTEPGRE